MQTHIIQIAEEIRKFLKMNHNEEVKLELLFVCKTPYFAYFRAMQTTNIVRQRPLQTVKYRVLIKYVDKL